MSLTQTDAHQIAKKLGAQIQPRRKHDVAVFRHKGKFIAQFGIRRASKDVGHDYIPKELHLSAQQRRDLRDCPLSLEGYVKLLESKGIVQPR